jgi:hypothetical protein
MGITVEFTDGCTDALTAVATTMVLHTTKVLHTTMGGDTGIIDGPAPSWRHPQAWKVLLVVGLQGGLQAMITWALIASAVTALVLVVLVQGKWTSVDSWFAAVFASAVMALVIDHYVNQIN